MFCCCKPEANIRVIKQCYWLTAVELTTRGLVKSAQHNHKSAIVFDSSSSTPLDAFTLPPSNTGQNINVR